MNNLTNYLTKRNIIIAAAALVIIIGVLIYFGKKPSPPAGGGSGGGGFFSGLFPGGGAPPPPPPTGGPTPPPGAPTTDVEAAMPSQAGPLPLSSEASKKLPVGSLIKLTDGAVSSILPQAGGVVKFHKNTAENLGHLFERSADGSKRSL